VLQVTLSQNPVHFFHIIQIQDVGAVYFEKTILVQQWFYFTDAFGHHRYRAVCQIDFGIGLIFYGAQVNDVLGGDHLKAFHRVKDQLLFNGVEFFIAFIEIGLFKVVDEPFQGVFQLLPVDGFEQVIESGIFKGKVHIIVVGRGKDHLGAHVEIPDDIEDLERVTTVKVDIKKYQVGFVYGDGRNAVFDIVCGGNYLYHVEILQQIDHEVHIFALIFNDDGSDLFHRLVHFDFN
jgi:hypothetical protein